MLGPKLGQVLSSPYYKVEGWFWQSPKYKPSVATRFFVPVWPNGAGLWRCDTHSPQENLNYWKVSLHFTLLRGTFNSTTLLDWCWQQHFISFPNLIHANHIIFTVTSPWFSDPHNFDCLAGSQLILWKYLQNTSVNNLNFYSKIF